MKQSGFTLVELMIVIAIIGVLAASLFPMMSGYMAKARDTARVADMSRISQAVFSYKQDVGTFPSSNQTPILSGNTFSNNLIFLLPKIPIEAIPVRPQQPDCWWCSHIYSFGPQTALFGTDADAPSPNSCGYRWLAVNVPSSQRFTICMSFENKKLPGYITGALMGGDSCHGYLYGNGCKQFTY